MKLIRKQVETPPPPPQKEDPSPAIVDALIYAAEANRVALTGIAKALNDPPPKPTSFRVCNLARDKDGRIVSFNIEIT